MNVYPMKRIERIEDLVANTMTPVPTSFGKALPGYRAHICSLAILGSDLFAFLAAVLLAFSITTARGTTLYGRALENLTMLGTAWPVLGSFFVVVCLFRVFR